MYVCVCVHVHVCVQESEKDKENMQKSGKEKAEEGYHGGL